MRQKKDMKSKLKKLSPQFKKILKNSSDLANSLGVKVYLVGGVVRDLILNKSILDLDIVVEGDAISFAKKLANLLKSDFCGYNSFGTATISFNQERIDFATARTEKYSRSGILPKVFPACLDKDLLRRDFTINAMAISLNKNNYGKLIDLYNGMGDLRAGLIRILNNQSFQDDPTRILRAIRFEQRFSFKIESDTFKLVKEALSQNRLELVGPHRLRDEVIIILNEKNPYKYIKRINELVGLSFIDKSIKLDSKSFQLFRKIQESVVYYKKKFKKHPKLDAWLLYLAAILIKLSPLRASKFFNDFGFRKKERDLVCSIIEGKEKIKKLNKDNKASDIYKMLEPYSFEAIIFFYAYYQNKLLRKNIEYFLDKLVDIELKIKGRDLKAMNLKPETLFGKVLEKTFCFKLDKGLVTKGQEIEQAKSIFNRQEVASLLPNRKGLKKSKG
ncbi:MAG: CCA tRNA nucleotidyltransferase [Candidatus Susulua stagnicola]|nr:CCA tRNA nucleotidyltransferase [Candidatus Susulua stagnicola]